MTNTDHHQVRRTFLMSALVEALIFAAIICIGVAAMMLVSTSGTDSAFVELITIVTPVGIKGIIMAGVIAVVMSTADSQLHAASVVIANDVVSPLYPDMTGHRLLTVARSAVLCVSFLSAAVALVATDIVYVTSNLDGIWQATLIFPIVCALYNMRVT